MLGPEKLPRVVAEVGRWVGRARAMARQFREQLEEEVQLEQARRAEAARAQPQPAGEATGSPSARAGMRGPEARPGTDTGGEATPTSASEATAQPAPATATAATAEPERPATYSHAHPTDATGARTPAAGEASQNPRADERGT